MLKKNMSYLQNRKKRKGKNCWFVYEKCKMNMLYVYVNMSCFMLWYFSIYVAGTWQSLGAFILPADDYHMTSNIYDTLHRGKYCGNYQ